MRINKDDIKQKAQAIAAGMAAVMLCVASVQADDTEIFMANTKTSSNANIVFVLDTSGSMNNTPKNVNTNDKKIDIVKNVFNKLIFDAGSTTKANPKYKDLNLALMRFDQGGGDDSDGGYFITDMDKLNNGSAKKYWDAVKDLSADGWTPLAETAYEAFLYFNGKNPKFGNTSSPGTNHSGVLNTNGTYKSPVKKANPNDDSQCTIENHLVILTDGLPTLDGNADADIRTQTGSDCSFDNGTNCLVDLAEYMKNTDDPEIEGDQRVTTHTIAFDLGTSNNNKSDEEKWLEAVAIAGGGMAINSKSHDQLIKGIEDILKDVIDSARTSVSPARSLSAVNNYVHDNTLYYALYKPTMTPKWEGNFKGYRMDENGVLHDFSEPSKAVVSTTDQTVDVNGEKVPVKKGEIMPNVSSKWSSEDGNNTTEGGAAGQMSPSRDTGGIVYTQTSEGAKTLELFTKSTITAGDLGVPPGERDALVHWALGKTVTTNGTLENTLRPNRIGDPLHSTPQVVNFGGDIGSVGFFGTNEGFLHAFRLDHNSGINAQEKFAFIPYALLKNLTKFKNPANTTDPHPYGLDGYISVLVRDDNSDGKIIKSDDDQVIIVVGMRRGGGNLYALDVTNLDSPELLWQISSTDSGFTKMGQTWSKPVITRMYKPNTTDIIDVVLFTGGYDPGYDKTDTLKYPVPADPKGNAIYAVDLQEGGLVWSSNDDSGLAAKLKHAIPASLTAIDVTQDKVIDIAYAIDIVGNIFRIDFNNTNYVPKGQLLADLSGDNRRFYNAINVAYSFTGLKPYFHLNVGSGFRAHPLDLAANDRFYSVLDSDVFAPLHADFTAITAAELTDKTTPNDTINDKGWYFDLAFSANGEKILSKATTRGGYIFFTSYLPPATQVESCDPPLGSSLVYAINLSNGDALDTNRHIALQATGIAPSPMFLTLAKDPDLQSDLDDPFASNDSKTFVIVGTEKVPFSEEVEDEKLPAILDRVAEKIYWTQQ